MTDQRLTMAHIGYDGSGLAVGDRVELHPGCDLWMRGARYGDVLAISPAGVCRVLVNAIARAVPIPAERLRVVLL